MALTPGMRLGVYDVTAQIGEGGMGQVFRATDTKLKRQVAIKILPPSLAADHDRLARFQREAEVLASLNHPNIAAIYGLEESAGITALVMELVEGEDLSQRIAQGAIAIDEALPIAKQIADALEAAHEQGIIHRDLKPANIKVRPDGTVKVLDFGLAKAIDPVAASSAEAMNSPTITSPAMTLRGTILGTAAYMAPEQARGKLVDRRADIWSFGCVLFEMLTGHKAFAADTTISDAIAAILTKEPDWRLVPVTTPPQIRTLLVRCLQKDPQKRLPHIGVAKLEIDEALNEGSVRLQADVWLKAADTTTDGQNRASLGHRVLPWVGTVASTLVAAAFLLLWAPWRKAPAPPLQRMSVELGANASLVTTGGAAAILSPDGQTLAFVAQKTGGAPQLYVRRLDQLQATTLVGTDGASSPFFSPDGRWIAFFDGNVSKLKKIAVTGGAAVTLCDAAAPGGSGTWGEDGTIVFSTHLPGAPLARVSSDGGTPEPLTTLAKGELTHRWPQLLPGGQAVLYTSSASAVSVADANLILQPLPSGPRKIIQRGATYGRYLPSGHLVYVRDGTLFAAPFDRSRLELTGPAVAAVEGVAAQNLGDVAGSGGAQFALADTGTLVYLAGQPSGTNTAPVIWMDRTGRTSPLRSTPADWSSAQFSPDGDRLAMDINDSGNLDVWVYDWARDAMSRLTVDPADDASPAWTPDGRRLAFNSTRDGKPAIYWQRADGAGEVQRLTAGATSISGSWHPSGKLFAYWEVNPETGADLMILPMDGDEATGWKPGKSTVFLNSPAAESYPNFSPDGRWLAYVSNESGRFEVYVRPFPGPGGKSQISTGGARNATISWSRARHELLFGSADQHIMVVSYVAEGDSFRADKPRRWSERPFLARLRGRDFDLHPDGERVAMAPAPETPSTAQQTRVVFIFNFFDYLRKIAPGSK